MARAGLHGAEMLLTEPGRLRAVHTPAISKLRISLDQSLWRLPMTESDLTRHRVMPPVAVAVAEAPLRGPIIVRTIAVYGRSR